MFRFPLAGGSIRRTILVAALLAASSSHADSSKTIYEGFGMSVEESVDAMSDKRECTLYVPSYPVRLAIDGKSRVAVWPDVDRLLFAFDGKHLVRIGTGTPKKLGYVSQKKALVAPDAALAGQIVKALATREPVKLRVVDWPNYTEHDAEITEPAFAYVYNRVQKQCNWPSLGVPTELPKAELFVHESKEPASEGYARAIVEGNEELELVKSSDKQGGGCHIGIGIHRIIGWKKEQWSSYLRNPKGTSTITVRDAKGETKLVATPPQSAYGNAAWSDAESVARVMWAADPAGSVSVTGLEDPKENVALYGFRALWQWGMEHCGMPAVEDQP